MPPMKHDGARYWRSLDELAQTPEFQEAVRREFPNDDFDRLPPATRRQFLKVMGASLAMAGLTACRWPKETIVPFAHRPEGRTPGVPEHFATSIELGGAALGMLVTSFDGRPIKAEGNPLHPDSLGALSAVAQAQVLELYDPERSRRLLQREGGQAFAREWPDFERAAAELFAGAGDGVAVLAEACSSPTRSRLRAAFLAARPGARWYEYEPVSRDAEREGARLAFGEPLRGHADLSRAAVVACLDADPLFDHPAALRMARGFAAARDPEHGAGARLYVAESSFSLTGARADHRVAVAAGRVPALLAQVARRLVAEHDIELPPAAASFAALPAAPGSERERHFVELLADDLAAHRGSSALLVGPRQAPAVHALAALLNLALGNAGATVAFTAEPEPERPPHLEAIAALAGRIREGSVRTLLILGGNPAYDAPADLGFAELLGRVPVSIRLGLHEDETSAHCSWHLPRAHALESWGDGRAWDGTVTLRQPLIEPLYGGRSEIEVLAVAHGAGSVKGHELVRETVRGLAPAGDFESFWARALHDGLIEGRRASPARRSCCAPPSPRPSPAPRASSSCWLRTLGSSTADSPTAAGCRSCPTRSPRSLGTTLS